LAETILTKVCGEPLRVLGRDLRSELVINYEDPGQIGQDRLAAVEGALSRLRPPLVVLSVGTCVTAEAVSAAGALVAGAIAPGLEAHAAGLRSMTPHLRPALEQAVSDLRSGREPAGSGRSTAESLWLGLIAALAGTADRLVALMREQAGARAPVVATGGDAYLVARHSELVERVEPTLVLDGLRAIDERTP